MHPEPNDGAELPNQSLNELKGASRNEETGNSGEDQFVAPYALRAVRPRIIQVLRSPRR